MKAPEDLRIWIGGGVAASVLVLASGWLLLVSPELSTVPALHGETESAQSQNVVLQAKVTALKRQSAQMATLVSQLRTVRTQLPITAQLPAVIDQLDAQAIEAKLGITSFSIGAVTAVSGATTATTGTTDSGTTDSGTTGSSATTPTPSASADTTTAIPAAASAAGVAGQLFQIQLTIITSGPLRQQEAFLNAVQYGGARAALVSSTQLGSGKGSENTAIGLSSSMTTELAVFVAPQTPAVAAQLAKQLSTRSGK